MPVSRMRMRPWLEKMIDSKSIKGLDWMDKERTLFSIPWKHAARHGWELDKDACLFKQWAIHTGKYVEGGTSDPKTWKANFRCAMNSLPDIEEVKDRSINKGHQAVRVFRMLPETRKSREKRSKARDTKLKRKNQNIKQEDDTDYSDTQSPGNSSLLDESMSTQENTVDSTVRTDIEDFPLVPPSEVPDFCTSVTIEQGLSNTFWPRFEVSPDHSTDYDETNDIIEICRQMEEDALRMSGTADNMGLLSNEVCTSPGSQWSDASSVEELEDLPQYTLLASDLSNTTENPWDSFCDRLYLTL